jgi:hypothetical protein
MSADVLGVVVVDEVERWELRAQWGKIVKR